MIWPDQNLRNQAPTSVHWCFSTRGAGFSEPPYDHGNLGDHVGDDPAAVKRNRRALLNRMPGATGIQWLQQVHGIECLEAVGSTVRLRADACFTRQAGLACAVLTADCLPVLLMNREGSQVAAAHAGWRGLADGILLKTLAQFSPSSSVVAVFGPAIGPEAFEVGADVRDAFSWAPSPCFTAGASGKYMGNLFALAQYQLQRGGVECLNAPQLSTASDLARFYSYRREGQTGRQASLVWIA